MKRTHNQSPTFFQNLINAEIRLPLNAASDMDYNFYICLPILDENSKTQCHRGEFHIENINPPSYDQVDPPPSYEEAMFMWDIQHPRSFSTYAKTLSHADILY